MSDTYKFIMKKRVASLDLARVVCMLYIIGVWHLNNYLSPAYQFSPLANDILSGVTVAALGTFSYISGYLLREYTFHSRSDVAFFYRKRFIRFWPLFALSAVSLFLMHWMDAGQFFFGVSGLALFTPSPLRTLWYISMLMSFYAITPLVRWKISNQTVSLGRFFCLSAMLLVFYLLFLKGIVDPRYLMYSPVYIWGLFSKDLKFSKSQWLGVLLSSILLITLVFVFLREAYIVRDVLYSVLGCAIIMSTCFLSPYKWQSSRVVSFLAYGSMSAYLFHRQLFGIVLFVCGIKNGDGAYLHLWVALIVLFAVFIIAWCIQSIYDRISSSILIERQTKSL